VRFNQLMAGRMAVVISHRFSTVRMADRRQCRRGRNARRPGGAERTLRRAVRNAGGRLQVRAGRALRALRPAAREQRDRATRLPGSEREARATCLIGTSVRSRHHCTACRTCSSPARCCSAG
jgi:hypothetical protein